MRFEDLSRWNVLSLSLIVSMLNDVVIVHVYM